MNVPNYYYSPTVYGMASMMREMHEFRVSKGHTAGMRAMTPITRKEFVSGVVDPRKQKNKQ